MVHYEGKNVINGSWSEVWINGNLVANAIGLQAKVSLKTSEIHICRDLAKHSKVIGYEGKGTLKLNKVDSMFINLMSENMKKGKQTVCTIISKLADPDAFGVERICLKDCIFEELNLINWEAKKNCEESIPFSFSNWEPLDTI